MYTSYWWNELLLFKNHKNNQFLKYSRNNALHLNNLFKFIFRSQSFNIFLSLAKRELRFINFNVVNQNTTCQTVNKSSYFQQNYKQMLSIGVNIHIKLDDSHASIFYFIKRLLNLYLFIVYYCLYYKVEYQES